MSLNSDKTKILLKLIEGTRDQEMACDECLTHLASLVESKLQGRPLDEVHQAVAAHLDACPDCTEEFTALRVAVESITQR